MSVVLEETANSRTNSRSVAGQELQLEWTAFGSDDEAEVRTALEGTAPLTWDDLVFVGSAVRSLKGGGMWACTADYAFSPEQSGAPLAVTHPALTDALGPEWEFDLTAQTAHVTQSRGTVVSRAAAVPWEASTAYKKNDRVTNDPTEAETTGRVYVCTTAGTSDSSGGPTGTGAGITDGTAVWDYVLTLYLPWQPDYPYIVGQRVVNDGAIYLCTTTGNSAATGGPAGTGDAIVDGAAEWEYVDDDTDPGAPDYRGAIGVTRDQVTGCDVYTGHLEFAVTAQVYPGTLELVNTLRDMVGTTNADTYLTFAAGSLLYLGFTGACKPGKVWTLKHRFAVSPPLTNIPVGPDITVTSKAGWDFLWAAYGLKNTQPAGQPKLLLNVPVAAYVERVYRRTDFTALPI